MPPHFFACSHTVAFLPFRAYAPVLCRTLTRLRRTLADSTVPSVATTCTGLRATLRVTRLLRCGRHRLFPVRAIRPFACAHTPLLRLCLFAHGYLVPTPAAAPCNHVTLPVAGLRLPVWRVLYAHIAATRSPPHRYLARLPPVAVYLRCGCRFIYPCYTR